jgi:D-proline reductase (dithiol) PrdB
VCHQSVSLAARVLESAGICTVIIGAAMDIVNHCGVPRFVYNDMPLGNPMGRPLDRSMQRQTLHQSLDLVASASGPVIARTGFSWSSDDAWRANFMRVDATD